MKTETKKTKQFDSINIDLGKNPAVLDTMTWDPDVVKNYLNCKEEEYWNSLEKELKSPGTQKNNSDIHLYKKSIVESRNNTYCIAGMADNQEVLIESGKNRLSQLEKPLGEYSANDRDSIRIYEANRQNIRIFLKTCCPSRLPSTLGPVPALGIGSRMSTSSWPGVWSAMESKKITANAIQNSVRELNLLEEILKGTPPKHEHLYGFGSIEGGHTGSTFQGLWTAGVMSACKNGFTGSYGADADHIKLEKDDEENSRVKEIINAARDYTFYTIDISEIINFKNNPDQSADKIEEKKNILSYHKQHYPECAVKDEFSEVLFYEYQDKYWEALDKTEDIYHYIKTLKQDQVFDFELSIDERPEGIDVFGTITEGREAVFLLTEMKRREIRLTHIAPNIGIEKGVDYRHPGGYEKLSLYLTELCNIASDYEVIIDIHSGDDLSPGTRKLIGEVSGGMVHYKISPVLQMIFARILKKVHPDIFSVWWEDAFSYAKNESERGSGFASKCLDALTPEEITEGNPESGLFHSFGFASVGKRDNSGNFLFRDLFYTLSDDFDNEYTKEVNSYLIDLASEVFRR